LKKVKLNDIKIDGGTQSRVAIDQPTVYDYLECMKAGDEFPPMVTVFDGSTHWLVDGFHRYQAFKILGIKEVEVDYRPGTQLEAQIMSFGVNGRHGKPRTNEDKRKAVEAALIHEMLKDKTDYELAKICSVSRPFVASVRDPIKKETQSESKKKHVLSKAKKILKTENSNQITIPESPTVDFKGDFGPDEFELKSNEEAMAADLISWQKLLESDDKLNDAYEEIKRVNLLNAQLELRIKGLMNEKNEAVKIVKDLQRQLDRINKK